MTVRSARFMLAASAVTAALGLAVGQQAAPSQPGRAAPTSLAPPQSDLDLWLGGDPPAQPPPQPTTQPAAQPASQAAPEAAVGPAADPAPQSAGEPATQPAPRPFGAKDQFHRDDALPGVVELSDGKVLPGWLYTTRRKPWQLYVTGASPGGQDQPQHGSGQWMNIPFQAVLSIAAVVEEEKMELEWRWKAMGEPEKVFTGREYPTRRLRWRFRLIDGSAVEGVIKGQPLWVELDQAKAGPMILHERSKGDLGQKLSDLVYVRRVIVSRRLMEKVLADRQVSPAGSAPAP